MKYDSHFFTRLNWDVIELVDNEFRIRASVFAPVLGEMLYYIKILNMEKAQVALHETRVIMLIDKPKGAYEINGTKIRPSQKYKEPFLFVKLEDLRLRNCTYDKETRSLCDCCEIEQLGFWF